MPSPLLQQPHFPLGERPLLAQLLLQFLRRQEQDQPTQQPQPRVQHRQESLLQQEPILPGSPQLQELLRLRPRSPPLPQRPVLPRVPPLGVNSKENSQLEFWLEKSLEFWLEITFTKNKLKNW